MPASQKTDIQRRVEIIMTKSARTLLFIFFFSSYLHGFSQPDATPPEIKWSAKSFRIGLKDYELNFTAPAIPNIKLYAPGQSLDSLPSAQLVFNDSSATAEVIKTESQVETTSSAIFSNDTIRMLKGPVSLKVVIHFKDKVPAKLFGSLVYYYNWGDVFLADQPYQFAIPMEGGLQTGDKIKVASIDINHPVSDCGDDIVADKSLFTIFLLGFIGGLIALLTPCVFPMIPVTVTFFTEQSKDRKTGMKNAILYGLFIFLFYVSVSFPFHLVSSTKAEIFNNISTSVPLNLTFFIIFMVFALSFFGLFHLTLPHWLTNAIHSKSGHTNIFGIFFMAGTLGIVSFSCTGPILGSLLANVANEGAWTLTAGTAGFGLALGLPFALFAMFPNWLQSLPKSGNWMTDVKVVLGFVEVALAIKFFTNADNVQQWGIMKREVFVSAWLIISVLIVCFLLGWIKIAHSQRPKKFSLTRFGFIAMFFAFAVYLAPGLFNTKYGGLRLLSGFPPPLSYSFYKHHVLLDERVDPIKNDYQKALALAKAENKPLLIDFTGWACTNCRRMEENVWVNEKVQTLMNQYVVVSLYVDQRTNLPSTERITYRDVDSTETAVTTVGDKWTAFQKLNFNSVSQPQYAIISPNEVALTKTKGYTHSPEEFANWLKCGMDAMKK